MQAPSVQQACVALGQCESPEASLAWLRVLHTALLRDTPRSYDPTKVFFSLQDCCTLFEWPDDDDKDYALPDHFLVAVSALARVCVAPAWCTQRHGVPESLVADMLRFAASIEGVSSTNVLVGEQMNLVMSFCQAKWKIPGVQEVMSEMVLGWIEVFDLRVCRVCAKLLDAGWPCPPRTARKLADAIGGALVARTSVRDVLEALATMCSAGIVPQGSVVSLLDECFDLCSCDAADENDVDRVVWHLLDNPASSNLAVARLQECMDDERFDKAVRTLSGAIWGYPPAVQRILSLRIHAVPLLEKIEHALQNDADASRVDTSLWGASRAVGDGEVRLSNLEWSLLISITELAVRLCDSLYQERLSELLASICARLEESRESFVEFDRLKRLLDVLLSDGALRCSRSAEFQASVALSCWARFGLFPHRLSGWSQTSMAILDEAFRKGHSVTVQLAALEALTFGRKEGSVDSFFSYSMNHWEQHPDFTERLFEVVRDVLRDECDARHLEDISSKQPSNEETLTTFLCNLTMVGCPTCSLQQRCATILGRVAREMSPNRRFQVRAVERLLEISTLSLTEGRLSLAKSLAGAYELSRSLSCVKPNVVVSTEVATALCTLLEHYGTTLKSTGTDSSRMWLVAAIAAIPLEAIGQLRIGSGGHFHVPAAEASVDNETDTRASSIVVKGLAPRWCRAVGNLYQELCNLQGALSPRHSLIGRVRRACLATLSCGVLAGISVDVHPLLNTRGNGVDDNLLVRLRFLGLQRVLLSLDESTEAAQQFVVEVVGVIETFWGTTRCYLPVLGYLCSLVPGLGRISCRTGCRLDSVFESVESWSCCLLDQEDLLPSALSGLLNFAHDGLICLADLIPAKLGLLTVRASARILSGSHSEPYEFNLAVRCISMLVDMSSSSHVAVMKRAYEEEVIRYGRVPAHAMIEQILGTPAIPPNVSSFGSKHDVLLFEFEETETDGLESSNGCCSSWLLDSRRMLTLRYARPDAQDVVIVEVVLRTAAARSRQIVRLNGKPHESDSLSRAKAALDRVARVSDRVSSTETVHENANSESDPADWLRCMLKDERAASKAIRRVQDMLASSGFSWESNWLRLTESTGLQRAVTVLDRIPVMNTHKLALLHDDGATNVLDSTLPPPVVSFANALGDLRPVSEMKYYSGGLDTSDAGGDGRLSTVWIDPDESKSMASTTVVVFHVSSLMPSGTISQKRHVGNDNVAIVCSDRSNERSVFAELESGVRDDWSALVGGDFCFVAVFVEMDGDDYARVSCREKRGLQSRALRNVLATFTADGIHTTADAAAVARNLGIRADLACRAFMDGVGSPSNRVERASVLQSMDRFAAAPT